MLYMRIDQSPDVVPGQQPQHHRELVRNAASGPILDGILALGVGPSHVSFKSSLGDVDAH